MKSAIGTLGLLLLTACSGGSENPNTTTASGGQAVASGGQPSTPSTTGTVAGQSSGVGGTPGGSAQGGAPSSGSTASTASGSTTNGTSGIGGSATTGGVTSSKTSTAGASSGGVPSATAAGGASGGTTAKGGASSATAAGGASGGTTAKGGASSGGVPSGGTSSGTTAKGGTTSTTAAGGASSPATGAIYVAPTGSDSNPGTLDQPFFTLAKAASLAAPGVTIYLRGGTYAYGTMVTLSASGTAAAPISVLAYGSEKPVLDFATQPYASANRGLLLTGNYWRVTGLEVTHAGDNGLKLEGSHNRIERCVFHHNGDSGIQLGFAHETVNPNGENCAYNEIINCDSYLNFDFDSKGGDADGFACKMHAGKGNVFRGCRAWHNADDGWDLYETDWPVEITNSWTWHNGDQTDFDAIYLAKMGTKMSSYSGNGNGFKLGGNGTGGNSVGTHVVTGCVSFDNNFRSKKGFDQNSHHGGVMVRNCVAFGNGYNYMFEEDASSGSSNEFYNNVSFAAGTSLGMEFSSGAVQKNNSWQLAVTANAADFTSIAEALAIEPRQADGSLPNNGFARLVAGSDLIDQGLNIGLPYNGAAPDLGAYER